jgi:hypothetical protein
MIAAQAGLLCNFACGTESGLQARPPLFVDSACARIPDRFPNRFRKTARVQSFFPNSALFPRIDLAELQKSREPYEQQQNDNFACERSCHRPRCVLLTEGLTFWAEKLIVTPLMPGRFPETLLDPRLVRLSE